MAVEKNAKGFLKWSGHVDSVLPNGYKLRLDIGKLDEGGDYEDIEYFIKEDQMMELHKIFTRYIKDVGMPRIGDTISDGEEWFKIHKIYFMYAENPVEIQLDIVV
jgi:hypothetical protein